MDTHAGSSPTESSPETVHHLLESTPTSEASSGRSSSLGLAAPIGGASLEKAERRALLVVDVRPKEQFAAAHLPRSINVPYQGAHKPLPDALLQVVGPRQKQEQAAQPASGLSEVGLSGMAEVGQATSPQQPPAHQPAEIIVVCRRGNDSQEVVQRLHELGISEAIDVVGGLTAWCQMVDPSFPSY